MFKKEKILNSSIIGPLVAVVLVGIIITLTTDRFFTINNFKNISLQVSIISLMAIGSTLVIFTGGIDLSPGSMVALTTMILAIIIKFMGMPLWIGIIVSLLLGAFLGSINGFLSTYLRIPPFITTLAGMSIFRGIAFMFNDGSPIFSIHPNLETLFYGKFLGIPLPLYFVVLFYTMFAFIMKYTKIGREIYSVGGNEDAARLSGINVKKTKLIAFMLAGVMASFAAVLMAGRLNSGSPNYGAGMELQAIAAAVIGGASLSGGHGNVLSTLLGALTIVIVQNGLNLHAVPTSLQNITTGIIILCAVFIDMWRVEISNLFSANKKGA